jgi:hypothetical protein
MKAARLALMDISLACSIGMSYGFVGRIRPQMRFGCIAQNSRIIPAYGFRALDQQGIEMQTDH